MKNTANSRTNPFSTSETLQIRQTNRERLSQLQPAIVFDWKRTLYDPNSRQLINGTNELLDFLHQNAVPMFLVGLGGDEMYAETDRLGVAGYFSAILFRDGKKSPDWYAETIPDFYSGMIFVGDKLDSEIEVGNKLGNCTVRVRQGEFAIEFPESSAQTPDYTLESLSDARSEEHTS